MIILKYEVQIHSILILKPYIYILAGLNTKINLFLLKSHPI